MKVLIADDDPVQVCFLTKRLKETGHKVSTANDAIQAWLAAIRRPPDAIILDIQMPGGTGFAVLQQLKTDARTNRIPVIVVSGSCELRDKVRVKELGADEFLSKPVDMEQLLRTLSELVGVVAGELPKVA